ncbi:VOC family protein [Pseudorhodobacter sp.]|uniref:VOC family protein n=1 Tax=Pseudorhodobacter sp. TaxID=1934400 RepID=UPI0026484A9D|nr:VOC family protein [Pseudorhodobacter sp.]MDN5788815.1 VOC family protein [Pseudorhodobacter sp.]
MFSYVAVGTNDLPRAVRFYDAVLAPLGHERCDLDLAGGNATWGAGDPGPHLWVTTPFDGCAAVPGNGTMFSLLAATRAQVRAVYQAAVENGGTDAGAPGLRPQYGPDFFAAYLRDPDGNKFNAVCYGAE